MDRLRVISNLFSLTLHPCTTIKPCSLSPCSVPCRFGPHYHVPYFTALGPVFWFSVWLPDCPKPHVLPQEQPLTGLVLPQASVLYFIWMASRLLHPCLPLLYLCIARLHCSLPLLCVCLCSCFLTPPLCLFSLRQPFNLTSSCLNSPRPSTAARDMDFLKAPCPES